MQVLCHLNDLSRVEDYLRVVGRLHDSAGVEIAYLAVTGDAFCTSLKVQYVKGILDNMPVDKFTNCSHHDIYSETLHS